jgi:hypothetical protein
VSFGKKLIMRQWLSDTAAVLALLWCAALAPAALDAQLVESR